jgi:hypothetical protein
MQLQTVVTDCPKCYPTFQPNSKRIAPAPQKRYMRKILDFRYNPPNGILHMPRVVQRSMARGPYETGGACSMRSCLIRSFSPLLEGLKCSICGSNAACFRSMNSESSWTNVIFEFVRAAHERRYVCPNALHVRSISRDFPAVWIRYTIGVK